MLIILLIKNREVFMSQQVSQNMATQLKRKLTAKNVTAMVLFGAIILVFVFFGFPNRLGNSSDIGAAAVVNSQLISVADFSQETDRISQYYSNMLGGSVDIGSQRQMLQRQALESLIRSELVSQSARKEGIMATDYEVREYITKDIPVFQQGGIFQRELYGRYLEMTQSTPGEFEQKIRKDIENLRTRRIFEMSTRTTPMELNKFKELQASKINVAFVKIDQIETEKKLTKEKYESELKKLEEALHQMNENQIETSIKNLGAKWDETGYTDLASGHFQKLQGSSVTEAIFDLKKSQPYLNRLIRDGNFKYVLKFKGAKKEEDKNVNLQQIAQSIQRRRGEGLFSSWISYHREKSNIEMNQQLFRE